MNTYNIYITELRLENFRGFKGNRSISLDKNLTVFIGDNGAGKTAILNAISYHLMYIRKELTGGKLFDFPTPLDRKKMRNFDVNNQSEFLETALKFNTEQIIDEEKENTDFTLVFRGETNLATDFSHWEDEGQDEGQSKWQGFSLKMYQDKVQQHLESVPVLIYYNGNANNADIKEGEYLQADIFDTYEGSLEPQGFDFTQLFLLLDRQQKIRLQNLLEENLFLGALETVLSSILSDEHTTYKNLRVEWGNKYDEVLMDKYDLTGEINKLALNQLSSGEKKLLGLLCDLTRRLFIANPDSNPLEGNGIVLIDEIDVHLHPKWQKKVVPKLQDIFPNIQFIVTTHSPLVLNNIYSKHIRALESGQVYSVGDTFGHDNTDEMLQLMGVESEIKEKIKIIHRLLREGKINEAKEIRNAIETEGIFIPLYEIDLFIKRKERTTNEAH